MLYHSFVFAFCYGIGFITSISGISLTSIAMFTFGSSRIQFYLLFVDLVMLVQSMIARWSTKTDYTWIVILILHGTYTLLYCMYPYLRCYPMMRSKVRILGFIGYPISYAAFLTYELGVYGFISNSLSLIVFVAVLPFVFSFALYQYFKIAMLIKQNPMHNASGKQTRLLVISYYTIIGIVMFAGPGIILGILGSWLENGVIWDANIGSQAALTFVCVVSNFLMTLNRYLQDNSGITGSEIFASTPHKMILDTKV